MAVLRSFCVIFISYYFILYSFCILLLHEHSFSFFSYMFYMISQNCHLSTGFSILFLPSVLTILRKTHCNRSTYFFLCPTCFLTEISGNSYQSQMLQAVRSIQLQALLPSEPHPHMQIQVPAGFHRLPPARLLSVCMPSS